MAILVLFDFKPMIFVSCVQVAIICNHQRTISKSHGAQMSRLTEKIEELKVINISNTVLIVEEFSDFVP